MSSPYSRSSFIPALMASLLCTPMGLLAQAVTESSAPAAQHVVVPIQSAFRGNPVGLVWVVVLVGFATASFVQWGKDFFRWRYNFHRRMVREWIDRRAQRMNDELVGALRIESNTTENRVVRAHQQLEDLAGAEKGRYAWEKKLPAYTLPAEQLCGQLASATEVAVAAPEKFPELFGVLTAADESIPAEDFKEYISFRRKSPEEQQPKPDNTGKSPTAETGELSATEQRYGELRSQFAMQAQRALDNLQIALGERWRVRLTAACLLFSFAFALAIVLFLVRTDPVHNAMGFFQAAFTVIVITIAGVLLAPVAHDLMRALRSFRR